MIIKRLEFYLIKHDERSENKVDLHVESFMQQLQELGNEQTKRTYLRHGAREPLYGITTGALKPLAKQIKRNYELSMELYATGNYDAMYFAGMIAHPIKMTEDDFEEWMQAAYCHGLSDYVVAITLSESSMAQAIADKWIKSDKELYVSAGWSCYASLLGHKSDDHFNIKKIQTYLKEIEQTIHLQPNRVRYAMNNFVIAVGISYVPLHQEALQVAKNIGSVSFNPGQTNCKIPLATSYIQKAIDNNRIGFKRKKVRC